MISAILTIANKIFAAISKPIYLPSFTGDTVPHHPRVFNKRKAGETDTRPSPGGTTLKKSFVHSQFRSHRFPFRSSFDKLNDRLWEKQPPSF
jgi:hypothetical protein